MISRRARQNVPGCVMILLAMTSLACESAHDVPHRPSPPAPEAKSPPALPAKALVKFDDLQPPIARPLSKPYPRRLPAGAAKAMREARDLQEKKNFVAAVEKLQRALDFDPDNPHIRQMLGVAQLSLPNYGEALKNFKAAVEYLSDDVQMQILLGQLYRNLRQPDNAILHFRTALLCSNAKPSNPQAAYALLALSRLLEDQGYWTAALETLTTFQTWVDEHERAYESNALLQSLLFRPEKLKAMRGHLLSLLHRDDEAVPLLQNAYHRNRSDAQTAGWLFEALLQAGQYQQAEAMLVEMAGAGPLTNLAPTLAKRLCEVSDDPTMPLRVWRALRTDEKVSAPLAMSLAQLARRKHQPKQAMAILDDLLKESPHHPEGVRLLAELSMQTGDRIRALKLLASLIQANPQSPDAVAEGVKAVAKENTDPTLLETFSEETYRDTSDAKFALHYVAGLLALQENKPLKAADHFQRAIRDKKDFYPAYDALLDLHLRAKDTEALQVLLDLCKEVAEEEYYYNYLLGRAQLSEGKPDQAIDSLVLAKQKNASHLPTLLTLARAYRMQANRTQDADVRGMFLKQAQSVLQQAIRLTPDATETYRALFDLYLESGDEAKALDVAETLMRRQPDRPDGALMQAEAFLKADQLPQARLVLQRLVRRFPNDPTIQLLAVQAILKRFPGVLPRPVYDQAVERLRNLLKKNPDHDKTRRFLAQLLSQPVPGRYDQAVQAWAEVVQYNPDDAKAAELLAMMYVKAGQFDKALTLLRRLRDTSPKDLTLRLLEVDVLVNLSQTDEAIQLIRSWWDQDKTNSAWVMLLLDILQETRRYDEAIKLLDEIKSQSPPLLPKEVCDSRSLAFLCKKGEYDLAIVFAQEKNDPLCYAVLTDELAKAKKFDVLIQTLQTAQAGETDATKQTRLRENLLYALSRAGRFEAALAKIDKWIKDLEQAQPRPAGATAQLAKWRESAARMLMAAGKRNEMARRLKTYLANDPNNAELHNLQSSLLAERGKTVEAVRQLERAHKLRPRDPSYQNNLAYILAEEGTQLQRAERLIRESLQRDGPRTTTADTLAWVYYKQGRLGEAAEVLVSLLPGEDLAPGRSSFSDQDQDIHPVIWDHAGDTFYRLGWADRAVRYWKKALQGAKKEPVATREIHTILNETPKKLQAVREKKLPPVAPLGKKVESDIEKTLQEYRKQHPNAPTVTTQPAGEK